MLTKMVSWKLVTKTVSCRFPLIAKYVPGYALLYTTFTFNTLPPACPCRYDLSLPTSPALSQVLTMWGSEVSACCPCLQASSFLVSCSLWLCQYSASMASSVPELWLLVQVLVLYTLLSDEIFSQSDCLLSFCVT